jgi:hypothetical protein
VEQEVGCAIPDHHAGRVEGRDRNLGDDGCIGNAHVLGPLDPQLEIDRCVVVLAHLARAGVMKRRDDACANPFGDLFSIAGRRDGGEVSS